jgi:hypothetical protein
MKNLIISVVGDESLHPYWVKGDKQFHTYLIYYGVHKDKYKGDCDFYLQKPGSKYFLYYDLIKENPDFFWEYDAVFMPDDDLYLTTEDLNKLFSMFHNTPPLRENGLSPKLHLAQPSIVGWYSLWITLHDSNYIYRLTNFVEIMCPVFSRYALQLLWPTFNATKSSWGLDMIWDYELGHPRNKIAILDDVIAIHTREVKSGDLYKNHTTHNPFDDLRLVGEKYGLPVHELTVYDGKKKNKNFSHFHPLGLNNFDWQKFDIQH